MKKLLLLAVLAMFAVGAQASGNCKGKDNCNTYEGDTYEGDTYNKGGTGVGIGVGIGKGGDANVGNGFGNFSPSAKAYGGDADVDNYNANIGVNKQGQGQDQKQGQLQGQGQDQGQYQKANAHQGQGQALVNNGPQVVIEDNKVITYEASSSPAIGPDVNVDQINVTCPLYIQDGWSVAGTVIAGAGSLGATDARLSEICALWLAAKNTSSSFDRKDAATAAYCLTFEKVGIENKRCVNWREDLAGAEAESASATVEPVALMSTGSNR